MLSEEERRESDRCDARLWGRKYAIRIIGHHLTREQLLSKIQSKLDRLPAEFREESSTSAWLAYLYREEVHERAVRTMRDLRAGTEARWGGVKFPKHLINKYTEE